ncbi:MAG: Aspartyl/glutamyl-tRNA(Asn/Gln) amidotransferase subunit C [Candidatus Falkowbacteria bacterium GW2011_GWF2_39_8]|uniref:Aspartyl/glutamyl-tRNA(Asn/Gln) amidotransferase subunit C n=1 Tax=Candidatus Falkowbacteria bacterium GW2011_GWF2_39_8 TaxID=1618642 RepID=A0A0G0PTI3_9BACT|nr:MAG: Aspartyl/glutamyl-tRNA(Asn/Gln) amidotransferase subunit C [Candidatus Falkowbacteria bacterium GW2011_GWF2_39_8]
MTNGINMKLTKQEIEHVAKLARLELSEEEIEKFGSQLSGVLDYIDQLKEVDVTGIEPTAQVTGLVNAWREDVVEYCDTEIREAALSQAPEIEEHQVKVKRILE